MKPRGFTLIEITVALLVGGMALSAAAALLTGLGERVDQVRAATGRADREANAERMLRGLFENLRYSDDSTRTLTGDSSSVTFYSRCETVEGWLRPCTAVIAVDASGTGIHIRLTQDLQEIRGFDLPGGDGRAAIRYLKTADAGGEWTTKWTQRVVPTAVQLIQGPDSLLFPIW